MNNLLFKSMNNFDITYSDGTIDTVKRVTRAKLKDLIVLQQKLLYFFLTHNANVGACVADDACWSVIETTSKLLAVVGDGAVKLELLEDNLEQLSNIFFTTSTPEEIAQYTNIGKMIEAETWYKPSLISQLHQLNYRGDSGEAIKKLTQEQPEVPTL